MKLAKKNNHAMLSFEITVQTRQSKNVSVTQDVKIEVMRPADVEMMKEPMCPEPDVSHIFLLTLTTISTTLSGPHYSPATSQTPYCH